MILATLFLLLSAAPSRAAASAHDSPKPGTTDNTPPINANQTADANRVDAKLVEGPVDFRCDNMFIYTKPNRNVCRANVVIRRGDMLVCCELFEGKADDQWVWQSFTCSKDVRAQRGIETVWADKAEFFQAQNDLVLTGKPVLHRGDSMLEGERVIVDVKEDHARILKPRGRMDTEPNALPKKPAPIPQGPLPAKCPIPALQR